ALGHALAELGHRHVGCSHRGHDGVSHAQKRIRSVSAASIFSASIRKARSSGGLNGIAGTSGAVNRVTGPSSHAKARSPISAATSLATEHGPFASMTTSALPVFLTESSTV